MAGVDWMLAGPSEATTAENVAHHRERLFDVASFGKCRPSQRREWEMVETDGQASALRCERWRCVVMETMAFDNDSGCFGRLGRTKWHVMVGAVTPTKRAPRSRCDRHISDHIGGGRIPSPQQGFRYPENSFRYEI